MIVQTAQVGSAHLVIKQTDHAAMSGQLAAAFGNDAFASLSPLDPMVHVAGHHDDGWTAVDAQVLQDADTGLPYHLTQTPLPYLVTTSVGSPDANEAYHPYSGLISSMHTYGLFRGRYGLSDKIFVELIPPEHKPAIVKMLNDELARQQRLTQSLYVDDASAAMVTEANLFHNYKLLQFFDTLALYFHMVHQEARTEARFLNVPQSVADDVAIDIVPVGDGVYRLSPYPFAATELAIHYVGRPMSAQPAGTDLQPIFSATEPVREDIWLVA